MKKLPRKLRDPLIFLGLLIAVPSFIYFISMNFGDQRVHLENKQWHPGEAADQGVNPQQLKMAAEYIETRLPMARGMIIIKNNKTIHEKYYWKGGPQQMDYLHSLNRPVLHALVGIAIERQFIKGRQQPLADFFPDYFKNQSDPESSPITIKDLLQVQAPLIWGKGDSAYWELFYSGDRIEASIRTISGENAKHNPAANFAAAYLLAKIISSASSMSIFEFADQYLFTPMGIQTLSEIKDKGGLRDPFIGFKLRTLDLAQFGYLVMNKGVWQGSQIIPAAWINRMTEEISSEPGKGYWGGWQLITIDGIEGMVAAGEGGQYIVLAPGLDMLIAVSSKSRFPLSENSGYDHLFQLIFESAGENNDRQEISDAPEVRPFVEPNFVFATEVPEDIRRFFHDFAADIATQDINRILYHYAKGYENKDNMLLLDKLFLKGEDFRSMYGYWQKMFFGGTGELEFVQIEKFRLDGNRAYLRGNLKYSYANMNTGSIGWFPLENLIRLRGRWLWLGSPTHGEILDRDEYFDAEISIDLKKFIDECGTALNTQSGKDRKECFAEGFQYNGLHVKQIQDLLNPLWDKSNNMEIHITKAEEAGDAALVEGYFENSLVGRVRLPAGMKVFRQDKKWRWSGNGIE
jgi:CubicO group peptidase (beta-lactamase class C family)